MEMMQAGVIAKGTVCCAQRQAWPETAAAWVCSHPASSSALQPPAAQAA